MDGVSATTLRPAQIIALVAENCEVEAEVICSEIQKPEVVAARWLAAYFLTLKLGLSQPKTGKELGGKDHTTIRYGVEQVKERLLTEKDYRLFVQSVNTQIDLHMRLNAFCAEDLLATAHQVISSRRLAMMASVDEIQGLAGLVLCLKQVADCARAVARHLSDDTEKDWVAVHSLCRAIEEEMNAIEQLGEEHEQ